MRDSCIKQPTSLCLTGQWSEWVEWAQWWGCQVPEGREQTQDSLPRPLHGGPWQCGKKQIIKCAIISVVMWYIQIKGKHGTLFEKAWIIENTG